MSYFRDVLPPIHLFGKGVGLSRLAVWRGELITLRRRHEGDPCAPSFASTDDGLIAPASERRNPTISCRPRQCVRRRLCGSPHGRLANGNLQRTHPAGAAV